MRILTAAFAAAGVLVSATGALAQQPLRVGYIPVMGVAQIFVAEGEGWTKQAGVKNTFVRLAVHGIRGNGHMMMLEKNNLEIAAFLRGWEQANIR